MCTCPARAFLGTWIVFESYIDGNPDPYIWSVNDSLFFILSTPDPSTEFYAFACEFEADTLNLTSKTGMPFAVYWRFRKTP